MTITPLPSLLLNAARSAAFEDGLSPPREDNVDLLADSNIINSSNKRDNHVSEQNEQDKKEEAAAGLTMVANAAGKSVEINQASMINQSNINSNLNANSNKSSNREIFNASMTGLLNNKSKFMNNNRNSLNKSMFPSKGSGTPQGATNSHSILNISQEIKVGGPSMVTSSATARPIGRVSHSQPQTGSTNSTSSNTASSNSTTSNNTAKPNSSSKSKGPPLRRGKWTAEEENYANRLIQEFKAGLLPLTDGTTLRTFLSKLLNCDPMRISKKFVGSNCIGKQVFRRRTADIKILTPEHIEQSRKELSELERRFLERVAQTNRVKSNGTIGTTSASSPPKVKLEEEVIQPVQTHNPPWLRPPNGFKPGAPKNSHGTNSRAAAVGRALLQGTSTSGNRQNSSGLERKSSKPSLNLSRSQGSAGLLALIEMQRRRSEQNLVSNVLNNNNTSNGLNGSFPSQNTAGLSNTAMAQIARNASAARIAGLAASGHSLNSLMLKTGLSRDQLSQLARDQQSTSSHSLSNMMERQSSFDALMSLDFQSLQSIDNLANLIQSGGASALQVPKSGLKNWEAGSSNNLSSLADARRRVSEGRMESLIRTLSSGNVGSKNALSGSHGNGGSNATFGNLLQSMQNMGSANSLFSSGNLSNAMLANMLRTDSSTGLTALRMQDGLVQRNSSVDDFLSLVASGDIPHQDPHLLNVPLQSVMQQQQQQQQQHSVQQESVSNQNDSSSGAQAAATYLAQQQLLAQAASNGNSALSNAMFLGLGNNSAASLISQLSSSHRNSAAAAALAQQQARAAQMNMNASALSIAARAQQQSGGLKRKSPDVLSAQGPSKR